TSDRTTKIYKKRKSVDHHTIMFLRKNLLILLALLSACGVAACRKASAPAQQTTANSSISEQAQQPAGGITPPETWYFKGSIGSSLGLQMKLLRASDKLTGTYFYQK